MTDDTLPRLRPGPPAPTFNLSRAAATGDDAWAAWEARLDATADARRMDPAIEAQLLANDAVFRRRRAAVGGTGR